MFDKDGLDWIARSNAEALYHLERQGRTSLGLIPFVGAGISTSFGFKDWKRLLLGSCPPRLLKRVQGRLAKSDYEGAAELLLVELGPDAFQGMVAAGAGDRLLDKYDLTAGSVSLLPLLANGPVVTTNFDRILERAFADNAKPFDSVVSGPRPDLIVDALHGNRRVLIKLHGDWQDRVGRTFARSDYDAHYGEAQPERKRELLSGAERLLFSSRSLLFVGASLGPDRTVQLLQEVHQDYAGVRHFAVMSAPKTIALLNAKEQHLRSCGVTALWYFADSGQDHALKVEAILTEVVRRISLRTLQDASPVAAKHPSMKASAARPAERKFPSAIATHFDRIERLTVEGRVTFFLGSAIHWPTKLMAKEFYQELARVFECEALAEEPFAVAQYISDRHGRETLDAEIRGLFARTSLAPTGAHELFAHWSMYRNPSGEALPFPTILTTNYDDVLEHSLREAGLPFSLFTYQASGPHKGQFFYQSTDDALQIVERPDNFRSLAKGFVVVKLNGGLDRRGRIHETFAATRLDYWDLAARIPQVLPEVLRRTISRQPLLFLGHGLAAPDVESFVRYAHRSSPGPRSWDVVLKTTNVEYWRQCGVEILNFAVSDYVDELRRRLLRL